MVLRVQGGVGGKTQRHRRYVPQPPQEALAEGTKVTILPDRGFGDAKLFRFRGELGFDYVIRFRGDVFVTAAGGESLDGAFNEAEAEYRWKLLLIGLATKTFHGPA